MGGCPDQARPRNSTDPRWTIRLRVKKSGIPGGISKELAFIKTGEPQHGTREAVGNPSNVDFGVGDEKNVLYITVDKSLTGSG